MFSFLDWHQPYFTSIGLVLAQGKINLQAQELLLEKFSFQGVESSEQSHELTFSSLFIDVHAFSILLLWTGNGHDSRTAI